MIGAEVRAVRTEFSESFAAGHAVGVDLATEWSSAGDGQYASVVETLTVDDGQTDGPFEAGARCKVYEAV